MTQETVFGITSHSPETADARRLLEFNRGHWVVENKSHWVRDVVFGEDLSQIRCKNGPFAFATLRNTAISLIKLARIDCVASELRACARSPGRALRALGISLAE